MALFFYWFCSADIWDDCNKLEAVLGATGGSRFYRFKWIFPMWIACLLWLSFNCTTTALSVSWVTKKKVHFIRTRGYWTRQSKPCPRFMVMCTKRRSINTMRCTRQFEEPNQDRRSRGAWLQMLRAFFAITNKQEAVQRGSLIQSKTRHQLSSSGAFISIWGVKKKGKCFGSESSNATKVLCSQITFFFALT